jgi:hypothetical protein
VAISAAGSAAIAATSAVTNQGGVSGASPCRLTTRSASNTPAASASAQRSVPLRAASEVITTCAPNPCAWSRMRPSSVATQTPAIPGTAIAASQDRCTSVLVPSGPASGTSGLPG